jgi:phage FluMu protein Com
MPIAFRCSQCGQLLRVPDTAAGKSARCPKCQALMTVPAASEEGQPAPQPPSASTVGWSAPESSPAAAGGSMTNEPFAFLQQPGGGGSPPQKPPPSGNPFGDTGGSPFASGATGSLNPYASPAASPGYAVTFAPLKDRPVTPQPVSVDAILSYAWRLWQMHLGLLVGVTVVIIAITWAISLPFGFVQAMLEQNREPEAAFAVGSIGNIVSNLVQLFLGIGQAQIALKLARRQPAAIADLFGGGPLFLPVLGASILGGIMFALGFLLLIIPGIILLLMFWPFYYLVVDQKTGVVESFSVASSVTQGNWGTAFLLWLVSVAVMILGCMALCIGVIFAAPLVTMFWAIAYLMMSGQISTDPLSEAYGT